jgi:GNAT superfamily N-acetyltransferase
MSEILLRVAQRDDLTSIVALLADDILGSVRETLAVDVPAAYVRAFDDIALDPRNELIVGDDSGSVVAVLQLTYIPGLTHQGAERAQIEGVRVAASHRGQDVGHALFAWAIERARARGCRIVQLTTDKRRPDAQRFYRSLGFKPTHEGMKLRLDDR